MKYRTLGKTGWKVSEVSLGTWQLGGKWGSAFDEAQAIRTVHAALDAGVNFIDTADVYSLGRSENAASCVIPGASNPEQAAGNAAISGMPGLSEGAMSRVIDIYNRFFREEIHQLW